MTSSMVLTNLLAYSAQVFVLIAAGAALPYVLRLRHPRSHLIYLRVLLAAALLLPAIQPNRPVAAPYDPQTLPSTRVEEASRTPADASGFSIDWIRLMMLILIGGCAIRLAGLLIGLWQLHRYRAGSKPLAPLPDAVRQASMATDTEALVCVSDAIPGPVTFGWVHPVILVPPAFTGFSFAEQYAIACHEFLHVRRRDWPISVSEELAGAFVWFHPAVWWLLSQIRLVREQAVDREVVAITQCREPYIQALLTIAGTRCQLDLAPAPMFLRRRHLTQRIQMLLKESSMPTYRLVSSYAAMSAALAVTLWLSFSMFPLSATPQEAAQSTNAAASDAPGVTVNVQSAILHRGPVSYPNSAKAKGVEGQVVLEATLDSEGSVSDARVISGPEELKKPVLASVLEWHFRRDTSTPDRVLVTVDFRIPPEEQQRLAENTPAAVPDLISHGVLESIDVSRLPEPMRTTLRQALAPFAGQAFSSHLMDQIRAAAIPVDRHLLFIWRTNSEDRNRHSLELSVDDGSRPLEELLARSLWRGNAPAAQGAP